VKEVVSVREFLDRSIPENIKSNSDYQVFIELMTHLFDEFKSKIMNFSDLICPDRCPLPLLPNLGLVIGYEHRYSLSENDSRLILKYLFERLYRRRGTTEAVRNAILYTGNPEMASLQFASKWDVEIEEIPGHMFITDWTGRVYDTSWIWPVFPAGVKLWLSIAPPPGEDEVEPPEDVDLIFGDIDFRPLELVFSASESLFSEIGFDLSEDVSVGSAVYLKANISEINKCKTFSLRDSSDELLFIELIP